MSSVDDRIVNMQFNNKQFESGATQSKNTLSSLESAMSRTGKSTGLTSLAKGAMAASKKFSIMQVAGVTAVATIANKAVNAGISLIKSLTIDPLKQGFEEYNTNLKSIQTVMANTGKGIKPVQAALQQLNKFSDQTIYNFSEMARNVGTFTAAGVGLKDSVSSIKGIANIAALAGSSSQQASTAMYQLSQAIAAGRVNLQDWNSVVNAGMGGKKLQTALITTGIAMGQLDANSVKMGKHVKNITIMGESFRNSISAKPGQTAWLTSGVLVKTLALMDGRLSMASLKANLFAKNLKLSADKQLSATEINKKAAAQLKINQAALEKQGFTPAQIKSLTDMADAAFQSATVIKTLPQLMGVVKESIGSVWSNAFTGIIGNFNQSKALWTSAGQSIQKAVNGFNAGLTNMIFNWKKGVDGIGGRTAVIQGFKNIFSTLGKLFVTVGKAFRDVFPPGSESTLAKISVGFMRLTQALVPSASTLKSLQSIFGGIFAVFHIGLSVVKGIAAGFGALFGAMFQGSGKAGGGVLALLGTVGEMLKGLDKMLTEGGKMTDFFVGIGTTIGNALHPIVAIIASVIAALGSLGGVGGGPTAFFESISSSMGGLAINGSKITGVFKAIGDSFKSLDPSKVASAFQSIGKMAGTLAAQGVAIAGGLITGLVAGLSSAAPVIFSALGSLANSIIEAIKSALGVHSPSVKMVPVGVALILGLAQGIFEGLRQLPGAIASVAGEIIGFFVSAFKQLFGGMNSLDIASMFNALLTGGLLLSMKKVSDTVLDFKKIINDVVGGLTNSLKAMQQGVKAYAIKQIAIAVALLAGSVIALSFIDPKKIAVSIGAIGSMVGILVGAIAALGKLGKGEVNLAVIGASMTLIAGAILTLAGAVAVFGAMDITTLIKGIGALAIVMGIMSGALAILGTTAKISLGSGPALLAMAVAINIMTLAVAALGNMDMGTLAKGLGAIAIGLALMTASLAVLGAMGPATAAGGLGLAILAGSLVVMAAAVLAFGSMDIKTLAIGIGAMAIVLTLMTASLAALGAVGPATLAGGAALVLLAAALGMLVPVVALLGSLDFATLAKGIGALAAILVVATVALAALGVVGTVVGPGLLILGAALALAGVGMLAFGTGFALMAGAGVAGVAVLTAAFTAIIALLPSLATQIAAALTTMIETFAKAAPRWRTAMGTIIKNMLGTINDNVPRLAKTLLVMIHAGLAVLRSAVPDFVETAFTLIDKFLKSAAKHAPDIIDSVSKLIVAFLNGLAKNMHRITEAGVNLILKFINGLSSAINKHADDLGKAGLKLAMALINGMTGGLLKKGLSAIGDAVGKLADKAKEGFKNAMKIFSPSKESRWWGEMIVAGLVNGLDGGRKATANTTAALAGVIPSAFESVMEIASPSKKAIWWGEMIGVGLAKGLYGARSNAVGAMIELVNAVIAGGDAATATAEQKARLAQATADRAAAKATILQTRANKMPAKTKAQKASKKYATNLATKAKNAADAAQKIADNAATAVEAAQTFRDADSHARGDIQTDQAKSAAALAAKYLARASAESAQAKRLARTNAAYAAKLRKQAQSDANAASKYATAALNYQKSAASYYATEVNDRIKAMQDAQAADAKVVADQAELDAATDPQAKADILNKRADALEAEAAKQKALVETLIAKAQAEASKNAIDAMKLLDQADAAAAAAKAAADAAAQDRSAAEQALGTDSTTGGSVGDIAPSRSVLEDAAKIVDSYSASMQEAQAAAMADQPVQQFVQNNYSPEALSVSEVYRQTSNLMSLAQLKMGGAKLPGDK